MEFIYQKTLKFDLFGQIEQGVFLTHDHQSIPAIRRLYAKNFSIRWLAKWLANREIKALRHLEDLKLFSQLPRILWEAKDHHIRSYIEGVPLYSCEQTSAYFFNGKQLLWRMRKQGVCNNDLAKEANWLVTPDGLPALVDFQLALFFKNRQNKIFLSLCYDDLRHLLKHKYKYAHITSQEKRLLQKKSLISRFWQLTGKKLYLFITRTLLGWQERVGPEERNI